MLTYSFLVEIGSQSSIVLLCYYQLAVFIVPASGCIPVLLLK